MRFSFVFWSLLFAAALPAAAQWSPPFDLEGCTRRAKVIARGTLNRQGELTVEALYRGHYDIEINPPDPLPPGARYIWGPMSQERVAKLIPHPLQLEVDAHQYELLRKLNGHDGPYEIVAFLEGSRGEEHWRPVLRYAGILGLKGDDVFVMQDTGDLAKRATIQRGHVDNFLYTLRQTEERRKFYRNDAYDAALITAARRGDEALVRMLIEQGADVNARSTVGIKKAGDAGTRPDFGATPLMQALYGGPDPRNQKIVALLLTKGASPDLADRYGETAMMIADRTGFAEAKAMLEVAGARPFDPLDPKVKAALVRIDAQLLFPILDNFVVEHSGYVQRAHVKEELPFENIERYCYSPSQLQFKVITNKGLDVCGHRYICRPFGDVQVEVEHWTVAELDGVVGPDYWEGFVPEEWTR